MKKVILSQIIVINIIYLVSFGVVFADPYSLPEPLVGQTEVTQTVNGSKLVFYGATSGNETVYNDDPSIDLLGFKESTIRLCMDSIIFNEGMKSCFAKDPNTNLFQLMTGATSYNGTIGVEVAALYYSPTPYISGDANLGGMAQNSFNYYGRHLTYGTKPSVDKEEGWSLSGNLTNPNSQAILSGEEYEQYRNKIDTLKGEAQATNIPDYSGLNSWYMQGQNLNDSEQREADRYPEGKVWKKDESITIPVTISNDIQYSGKGTLIIDRGLTINSGVSVQPKDAKSGDRLGIIVLGDVEIGANCDITAPIFATGTITMAGSNTTMTGSFVATQFIGLVENPNVINLEFFYDPALDTAWPPGFRYLNMPKPAR